MLGCNEEFDLESLSFPLIATIKKDGVRGIPRQGQLRTRAYKSQELPLIKNKQIQEFCNPLKSITSRSPISIDLEIYIHGLPLNEIVMFTNTEDIKSRDHYNKVKAKVRELTNNFNYYLSLPSNIELYVFDFVEEGKEQEPYINRILTAKHLILNTIQTRVTFAEPVIVNSLDELTTLYNKSIEDGFEGLVLRTPQSPYKYGRSTLKEGYFLKMKPFEEFEGTIVRLNERMLNFNQSEESYAGYSIKSKAADGIAGSGIAATATVEWNGQMLNITLKGTESERCRMWDMKETYVGRKLAFKGMSYGMKTVPRIPTFVKII